MVASAVRALDANVDDAYALANQIGQLGEPLYRKQEPTGYSNMNAEWVNSAALLGRMNFALNLAQNKVPGVKVDARSVAALSDPAGSRADLMSATYRHRRGRRTTTQPQDKTVRPRMAGLVLGSPDFQRR